MSSGKTYTIMSFSQKELQQQIHRLEKDILALYQAKSRVEDVLDTQYLIPKAQQLVGQCFKSKSSLGFVKSIQPTEVLIKVVSVRSPYSLSSLCLTLDSSSKTATIQVGKLLWKGSLTKEYTKISSTYFNKALKKTLECVLRNS